MSSFEARIDAWYEQVDAMSPDNHEARRDVELVITKLDDGQVRVAEIDAGGEVVVHEWIKKAILLLFRLRGLEQSEAGPFEYQDRLELKHDYARRGVRAVPGAIARRGSFLSPGVILMPSFVNIGAWVGPGTMVDTWATVGSGVLEPANAVPVVIEDDAFIGSRCMVVEGARVGRGSILGAGTILNPSIPVVDAETGEEVSRGRVPDYCVAVSASRRREFAGGEFFLPCVLIIRRLDEGERHDKVALTTILRDHGVAT
jgi:2,3,4,5-tetrahydropyridine-2-carboxylate N-succinyltransferase